MKRIALLMVWLVLAWPAIAQIGQPFPPLSGEILDGGDRELPKDYAGGYTLVGLGWSRKAEDALKTWHQPLYDKFVSRRGIFDGDYAVQLCFVAMYAGLKQTAYEATKKELRESNRKDLFPYILFYKGPLEPYDSKLGLVDKATPYFFLLDHSGTIIHVFSGSYSDGKLEKLEEVLGGG